jgi:hypothetical protein
VVVRELLPDDLLDPLQLARAHVPDDPVIRLLGVGGEDALYIAGALRCEIEFDGYPRSPWVNEQRVRHSTAPWLARPRHEFTPSFDAQFSLRPDHRAAGAIREERLDKVDDRERVSNFGEHKVGWTNVDVDETGAGARKSHDTGFPPEGAVVTDERQCLQLPKPPVRGPQTDIAVNAHECVVRNLGRRDDAVSTYPGEDL